MSERAESPVSFVVDVRRLPEKGFSLVFEADEGQRNALAAAHDLLSVEHFAIDLLVKAWKRDGISVKGRVSASFTQACVVTLEPLPAFVDEPVDSLFVPEDSPLAKPQTEEGEVLLAADGPDAPEVFDGHSVDAGALAEEFFALAIDPYPRSTGAAVATSGAGEGDSPFAVLAKRFGKS